MSWSIIKIVYRKHQMHRYIPQANEVCEASYDPSKLLVLVNRNIDLLASKNGKFNCLVCSEPFCDHIYRIKQLQLEENVSPIIFEFTSAIDFHGQQRSWITSKSSTKIDFVRQNKISLQKSIEIYMTYEDSYIMFKDTSLATCPLCSTNCHQVKHLMQRNCLP